MSFTTNPTSLLHQLRSVMPNRPLTPAEAQRVAELQANRLLTLCGVTEAGTPSEIVEGLRFLRVSYRTDLPTSGYTVWFKPYWHIMVNASEPAVRQRFSLMHELKHVLDHPFIDSMYPSTWLSSSERRAEQTADYFAACVLMPKRLVKRLYGEGVQRADELAATFGVSEIAMRFRLEQLGLLDRRPRCDHGRKRAPTLPGYFRRAWSDEALVRLVAA